MVCSRWPARRLTGAGAADAPSVLATDKVSWPWPGTPAATLI